jgi:uncharacterized protein (TIGR02001 family)
MIKMKKFSTTPLALAAMLAIGAIGATPLAARAAGGPSLSFNIGAVSDYRYRGISQSRLKPALQGGVDYGGETGFYTGLWMSTIHWIKDAGGNANVEIDIYSGYKGKISDDLGFDVGLLSYKYPSNRLLPSADTGEIYGALSFGPATFKVSRSLTNLFGFWSPANKNTKGSTYVDLSATFEVGGFSVTPHIGHQSVRNLSAASYTDYSLTVSRDFEGFTFSAALVGTDADKAVYTNAKGKFLGKNGLVLGVKKTF